VAMNRKVFAEAMRVGADAAWDGDWEEAIAAYERALREFPNDVSALTAIGLAYSNAGRLESALEAYRRASEFAPDDPVLPERIGRTLEQLGQGEAAAKSYAASAERYLTQQQAPHLAVERWQDAVRVYPDHEHSHVQLLQYYQRHGQTRQAVKECLALARIYHARGQTDYAARICRYGLKLSPHDPEVLAALEALRYGEPVVVEVGAGAAEASPGAFPGVEDADVSAMLELSAAPGVEGRGSPIETVRQKALVELAESVFEEGEMEAAVLSATTPRLSKAEIDALIGQAIDFQTRGKIEEAIAAYERVSEAGFDRPAVHFNLGLLYQEKLRFDDAIAQFNRAALSPDYVLGAHFALGECYRAKGRIGEALGHFIDVLKTVDVAAARRDRAGELSQLYESLADSAIVKGDREQALEFTNSLAEFLSETGWGDKVVQARQRLDALTQEGPALTLAELLTVSGSERILEAISSAQELVEHGKSYAALEECYYALPRAPTYLPLHRQLARVLLEMGKADKAADKLVAVADTYRVRGDVRQAGAVYRQTLELSPMDTVVRAKLIDLLVSHGEIDEALEHYMILADSYYHLAQMDQARDVYQEALRLAPQGDPERRWEVHILHKIGDIDMQRVDWKRAAGVYEQIRKLDPEDERARLMLIDLYYRFNRHDLAIFELDDLLETYRERGKTERIFAVLEDLVAEREEDIPLRARLAQAHLNSSHVEKALEHLDKLGELQLAAGRYEEAKATLRAIIALNPPNVAAYRQLLDQLG